MYGPLSGGRVRRPAGASGGWLLALSGGFKERRTGARGPAADAGEEPPMPSDFHPDFGARTQNGGASQDLAGLIESRLDRQRFQDQHWEGTFWEYLDLCDEEPGRGAQCVPARLRHDPVATACENYTQFKQECIAVPLLLRPDRQRRGCDLRAGQPLMQLVDFFKSAAQGYGTDKRILLLHGPVGSSKSTIARLLKKGLEHYSHDGRRGAVHVLVACWTSTARSPRRRRR